MITCVITYEIEPFKREAFERYARNWGEIIPACGGDLVGYFGPHEGSLTKACALIEFDSLAAYEAYRAQLREDAGGRENFAFAAREGFIRREDRIFMKRLCGSPARRIKL